MLTATEQVSDRLTGAPAHVKLTIAGELGLLGRAIHVDGEATPGDAKHKAEQQVNVEPRGAGAAHSEIVGGHLAGRADEDVDLVGAVEEGAPGRASVRSRSAGRRAAARRGGR